MPPHFRARDLSGLSSRARKLLLRRGTEGFDAEWKESLAGLNSEDLVAFANSARGGAVILGIVDKSLTIKDTPLTDSIKTNVLSKANSCFPPVHVEMCQETCRAGRLVRIEVPSGEFRPYCTNGGTYKIRGDGANAAIKPPLLLSMFLEREGGQFLARFAHATAELQDRLQVLKNNLEVAFEETREDVRDLDAKIEMKFDLIKDDVLDAAVNSDVSQSWGQEISGQVKDVDHASDRINEKVDLILAHLNLEDPVIARHRQAVFHYVARLWKKKPGRRRATYLKLLKDNFPRLGEQQLAEWYSLKEGRARGKRASKARLTIP